MDLLRFLCVFTQGFNIRLCENKWSFSHTMVVKCISMIIDWPWSIFENPSRQFAFQSLLLYQMANISLLLLWYLRHGLNIILGY